MASLEFYTVAFGIDETHQILKNAALAERYGFTVFSDRELDLPPTFIQRRVTSQHINPRISSRYWKLLSFSEFEADYSVYIDANICINPDRIAPLETRVAQGVEFAVFQHNRLRRIRDEILYCYAVGKLSLGQAVSLLRFAKHLHLPVFQGGVILRPTRNTRVKWAMKQWWELVVAWSERDQITGPIALKQAGIDWQTTKFEGTIHNSFFSTVTRHHLGNFTNAGTIRKADPVQRLLAKMKPS